MTAFKNEPNPIRLVVEDILQWTGATVSGFLPGQVYPGIFTDSRKVIPGGLFVALIGENFNGNQFAMQALQQGAAAALVSQSVPEVPGKTILYVPDTLKAFQEIARGYREQFHPKMVAVTGSVGKTTTKELLAWCLSQVYPTLKTTANHNNDIGVPETLFRLDDEIQAAVVEMGMRARGEIERLSRIVEPEAALITNVAPVHLETLGSLENIARTKCEIFSGLKSDGWGLINADIPLLVEEAQKTGKKLYTFGTGSGCDCRLLNTKVQSEGMELQVKLFQWEGTLSLSIPSEAIALDAVAAAGCAALLGVPEEKIAQALATYAGDGQRLHQTKWAEGGMVLDDTYNANPVSMAAALEALSLQTVPGKRVAVLGDMYELGSFEKEGHLQVGRKAAEKKVDLLVTIGKLGEILAEGAEMAGMSSEKVVTFPDKETALPWLKTYVTREDAVLFKASHGLRLDILLKQWEGGEEKPHE